jgi:hypothetical protein
MRAGNTLFCALSKFPVGVYTSLPLTTYSKLNWNDSNIYHCFQIFSTFLKKTTIILMLLLAVGIWFSSTRVGIADGFVSGGGPTTTLFSALFDSTLCWDGRDADDPFDCEERCGDGICSSGFAGRGTAT